MLERSSSCDAYRNHEVLIVASFGSTRELVLSRGAAGAGADDQSATPTMILACLPQSNNSVVCAGRDVSVGWKQLNSNDGTAAAAAKENHRDKEGTIIVVIRGDAMAAAAPSF